MVGGSRRCGSQVFFELLRMGGFVHYRRWLLYGVQFWSQLDGRCSAVLHAELHCPFWYCGDRPLQLLWPMRSEVAMIYPVSVWIYSVCSRDVSVRSIGEEI